MWFVFKIGLLCEKVRCPASLSKSPINSAVMHSFDQRLDWLSTTLLHRRLTRDKMKGTRTVSVLMTAGETVSSSSNVEPGSPESRVQKEKISERSSTGSLEIGEGEAYISSVR